MNLTSFCRLAAGMLLLPAAFGSTLDECLGNCAIWRWGPTKTDPFITARQPETSGWYSGHYGTFIYEDYGIVYEPFAWYSLGGDPGPNPGAPVETGFSDFIGRVEWLDGVGFLWMDTNSQSHLETVVAPTRYDLDVTGHSQYKWLCADGITPPPDLLYPPEPGTWVLLLSGAAVLALRLRGSIARAAGSAATSTASSRFRFQAKNGARLSHECFAAATASYPGWPETWTLTSTSTGPR